MNELTEFFERFVSPEYEQVPPCFLISVSMERTVPKILYYAVFLPADAVGTDSGEAG